MPGSVFIPVPRRPLLRRAGRTASRMDKRQTDHAECCVDPFIHHVGVRVEAC